MNSTSKILVTGSNGQLGSEIQKISNTESLLKFTFTDRDTLDIANSKILEQYFQENKYDYVINCAAYTAVDKAEEEEELCIKINSKACKNLSEICRKHNCFLIHISSDYVYNPEHSLCNAEMMPCTPKGVYAKSKYQGEEYIRQITDQHIIIRSSWVYSSFGHNFVKTMLNLAQSRDELSIVDDQIGSPTYALDLAKVILKIANVLVKSEDRRAYSGTYNYSNLGLISWADFATEIFRISSLEVSIHRIPTIEYPTPAPRPMNSRLSKSKIAEVFDIKLQHWKKSLVKCLKEIDN